MAEDDTTEGGMLSDDRPSVVVGDPDPWAEDTANLDDFGDDEPPEDPVQRERRERFMRRAIDWLVVSACAVFVFANLHPELVLSSAVPAGGDMGAHVWGPAFLRDHLLPSGRISGWTPDWYAGFPAYQFYMVVPSLLIVALDVGLFGGWTMIIPLLAGSLMGVAGWRAGPGWRRRAIVASAFLVLVAGVELPYGTGFKIVTILGVLTLPAAAYVLGRLADLPFPGPALLSVASVLFLFDRNFTIYGGNIASTLAGEFAFSISLSLAVVYLGVVIRGLRTGRHRALGAALLALTGLCHLIPAFFALAGTAVIVAVPLMKDSWWALIGSRDDGLLPMRFWRGSVAIRWLGAVLPVGGLISAFWVLPFFWQRTFVNDMGWEKLPYANAANGMRSWSQTLFTYNGETYWKYLIPRSPESKLDLRWVLALACMGLVLSIAFKVRLGVLLAALALVMGAAFVVLPEARLWNARLLPFYYLCLYFLAAVGVSEIARTLAVLSARDPDHPSPSGPGVATVGFLLAGLVFVSLPLRSLPGGDTKADGSYSWFGLKNGAGQDSFVRGWANWNYTGYEGKDAYREYRDLVLTMERVGAEHGCGRSFWEYEKELNRYGTPMALMLLPHWSDGCIGSMEGLFFEASATTPFHFLMQVELSAAPSAAQRDLPYDGFQFDEGVQHLQLMGVRYYLSTSVQATQAARAHADLTEVATSGPWTIFLVADSALVTPLENEPAVLDGVDDHQDDWLCGSLDDNDKCAGPAVRWFTSPDAWEVALASSGPDDWQRVDAKDPQPTKRVQAPVEVSNIEAGVNTIVFDVDRVGVPVLVKTSYFPNWRVQGGDGPYRVAPNLMVVVPTSSHVEFTYGREPVEYAGFGLSAVGVGLALFLATRPALVPRGRREDDPNADDAAAAEATGGDEPPAPGHFAIT